MAKLRGYAGARPHPRGRPLGQSRRLRDPPAEIDRAATPSVTLPVMFAATKKVRIARIALFALLFSASSSTLAAFWFQNRTGIPEICTTSGVKKILSLPYVPARHVPGKAGGGIYCAQCMASASAPAVATPPRVTVFAMASGDAPLAAPGTVRAPGNPDLSPPPRGPPAIL